MASNETQVYVPCTLETCSLDESTIGYQPNAGANVFFLVFFAVAFLANLYLGIRHRSWSYLAMMASGTLLEIIGYAARVQLHANPFDFDAFVQYLVCLTIAPAFLSAAIYFCFQRIVSSYDPSVSRIKPKTIAIIFITSDFLCLVLQATGGAITATSRGTDAAARAMSQTGINVMISGLVMQVVSLFAFIVCAVGFGWGLRSRHSRLSPTQNALRHGRASFGTALVVGLAMATLTIFTRSVYRAVELRDGFDSALATDEAAFMALEGAMIVVAVFCLTVFHPGLCFSRSWKELSSRTKADVELASRPRPA